MDFSAFVIIMPEYLFGLIFVVKAIFVKLGKVKKKGPLRRLKGELVEKKRRKILTFVE